MVVSALSATPFHLITCFLYGYNTLLWTLALFRVCIMYQLYRENKREIKQYRVLLVCLKIVWIYLICHFMAGVWFLLGNSPEGWVFQFGMDRDQVSEQYLSAL